MLHLACLKLGAVSNPLMTIFRERQLRFMLKLAESKVFVVPVAFRGSARAQRSVSGIFLILAANSTILRIASARDGTSI